MTSVRLEYGDGHIDALLPDDAIVVRSGHAHREPEPLPDPVAATRDALRSPVGSAPLHQSVSAGSTVTIAVPDRVKGGTQETAHRRIAVPLVLDELERAGVRAADVRVVCAVGLHRKNSQAELAELLGPETLERIDPVHIVNHDAEDPAGIVEVGRSRHGDPVQMNRLLVDTDLTVLLGHTAGNPYGGFSGGYKMPATGLTTWRSIRAHHCPATMHRPDFVPAGTDSRFRHQLTAIGRAMEAAMPRPFFSVDAVLDGRSRQLAVAAGAVSAVEQATWPTARQRTQVRLDGGPADVLVVGMPRNFHYGAGMGSNPILLMQAIGSSVSRAAAALRDRPVVIATSICDGWFNADEFPATVAVYDALQQPDPAGELAGLEEAYATRTDWVQAYRDGIAYHPFHAFSMAYMGQIAADRAAQVFIAGAAAPEYARGMGAVPTSDVAQALAAAEQIVGPDPRVLVVPELSRPAYHLSADRP